MVRPGHAEGAAPDRHDRRRSRPRCSPVVLVGLAAWRGGRRSAGSTPDAPPSRRGRRRPRRWRWPRRRCPNARRSSAGRCCRQLPRTLRDLPQRAGHRRRRAERRVRGPADHRAPAAAAGRTSRSTRCCWPLSDVCWYADERRRTDACGPRWTARCRSRVTVPGRATSGPGEWANEFSAPGRRRCPSPRTTCRPVPLTGRGRCRSAAPRGPTARGGVPVSAGRCRGAARCGSAGSTSFGYSRPLAAHICGNIDVGVKPGMVLISLR